MSFEPDRYRPMIDAILSVADLEEITVKRIRNALQELFAVDLLPHKKEMNSFILQRYYKLLDEKENPKSDDAEKIKKEREYQDHLLAQKLLRSDNNRPITRRGITPSKVTKKKTTRKLGRTPNTAFNAELVLSPQLQEVVKSERMSRPQVVKQIWTYIKANNLQDQLDKRKIHCDEKMRNLFKKLLVGMFEMNKLLGDHMYKDGEIVNGNGKRDISDEDNDDEEEGEATFHDESDRKDVKQEQVSEESEISDVDE